MDLFFVYLQVRGALRPIGRILSLRSTSLAFLALGLTLYIADRGASLDSHQVLRTLTGFARWISFQPLYRSFLALP